MPARPLIAIAISYIVGWLVANGYIEQKDASVVVENIDAAFGAAIILTTTVYGLHKFVHLHPMGTVSKTETKVETQTEVVIPDASSVAEGTPEAPSAEIAPSASY